MRGESSRVGNVSMLRGYAMKYWFTVFCSCALLFSFPVCATPCTSPNGQEGAIIYNHDYHTYQFCNGTSWIAFGPGSCFTPQTGAYQPTIPSGSGFFVLTSTTFAYNAHTSLAAWNAACLTELTTNTGWKGYSTANSNGQLVSAKVFLFGCVNGGVCNNLIPLATYNFANAGNSSAGGATFITDTNGLGPQDSAAWSAANYFSTSATYWTFHSSFNSATEWAINNTTYPGNGGVDDGSGAEYGTAAATNANRWSVGQTNSGSNPVICYVNP